MEVLAITIFLSLCLAGFFVVMFLGSGHRSRHSLEQEALMPLDDDAPRPSASIALPSNEDLQS
jgi:cbb3-type cytochrome oxidase subunit 3